MTEHKDYPVNLRQPTSIIELQQGSRVVRLRVDEIACLLKSSEGDLEIRLHGGYGFRIDNPEQIKRLWESWKPQAPEAGMPQ